MSSVSSFELVDTHCHLNFNDFDPDRYQVLDRARVNGICKIINPGIDIETSQTAIDCAQQYSQVFTAVGVHPNSALSWADDSTSKLRSFVGSGKVVAIGEIGLDYYRNFAPIDLQKAIFREQLELAAELGLPVIIHNRDASVDLASILQEWHASLVKAGSNLAKMPGVLHAFSGNIDFAENMVSMNFKLGIGGPVTYRNSETLQSVVYTVSASSLLIETDAPYLSPQPMRGKRNEPANVRIVAEKIAELRSTTIDNVASTTTAEADRLFNWRNIH